MLHSGITRSIYWHPDGSPYGYTNNYSADNSPNSSAGGPSAAGAIGSLIGNLLLWSTMENAVKMNAIGLGRSSVTGKFLSWISKGHLAINPLESVTSRMNGWIYAKKPGIGFFFPNKDMRAISRATYSAFSDLTAKEGLSSIASKEGLRLLAGSAASVVSSLIGVGMVTDAADLGISLVRGATDSFATLGRKFMFAPWSMDMSDANVVPQSAQYQAMHKQAVYQLMQSRNMVAQGTDANRQRALYNNPYDFYNFV